MCIATVTSAWTPTLNWRSTGQDIDYSGQDVTYSATSQEKVRSTVPFGLPPGTIPRTSSDCSILAAPSLVRGWFPGGGNE